MFSPSCPLFSLISSDVLYNGSRLAPHRLTLVSDALLFENIVGFTAPVLRVFVVLEPPATRRGALLSSLLSWSGSLVIEVRYLVRSTREKME